MSNTPVVDPVGNPPSAPPAAEAPTGSSASTTPAKAAPAKRTAKKSAAKPSTSAAANDDVGREVQVRPTPEERPYAEAITKEHRDFLKDEGVDIRGGSFAD